MPLHVVHLAGPPAPLPVVWLHGWTMDHRILLPLARALLGRAHLLPDLAGHGLSGPLPATAIADHAHDVLEVAPGRFVVAGHSLGGQVALEVTALAPERVGGVILLDPAHLDPPAPVGAFGDRLAARLAEEGEPALDRFLERQSASEAGRAAAAAAAAGTVRPPLPRVRAQWDAIRHHDGRPALAALRVPALALLAPAPVNPAAIFPPHVEIVTVQDAGHMLMFDAPRAVERQIRSFLSRVDREPWGVGDVPPGWPRHA